MKRFIIGAYNWVAKLLWRPKHHDQFKAEVVIPIGDLALVVGDIDTDKPIWAIASQPESSDFTLTVLDYGVVHLKGWDNEMHLIVVVQPVGRSKVDVSVMMTRIQEPSHFRQELIRGVDGVNDTINRLIAQVMEVSAL